MSEPIHKAVPTGILEDDIPRDQRYRLADYWMRETRRRYILVPRGIALYLLGFGGFGMLFFGDDAPGRFVLGGIGVLSAAFILVGDRWINPELTSDEMSAAKESLGEAGCGRLVDAIRFSRS